MDTIRENVIACALPAYADGFPPAIAYMACERVRAAACPLALDGRPNGYRLTPGASCKSARVRSTCLKWGKTAVLRENAEKRHSDFMETDLDEELEFYQLSVVLNDEACKNDGDGVISFTDRVFYIPKLQKGESLPLCAELNWEGLEHRLQLYNGLVRNNKVIVIRWFYTELCPTYSVNEKEQEFNAFVVHRLGKDEWVGRDVFMCSDSLRKQPKQPVQIIPGTGGRTINETAAEWYARTEVYSVINIFQDDRCGGGGSASNAYIVRFRK